MSSFFFVGITAVFARMWHGESSKRALFWMPMCALESSHKLIYLAWYINCVPSTLWSIEYRSSQVLRIEQEKFIFGRIGQYTSKPGNPLRTFNRPTWSFPRLSNFLKTWSCQAPTISSLSLWRSTLIQIFNQSLLYSISLEPCTFAHFWLISFLSSEFFS